MLSWTQREISEDLKKAYSDFPDSVAKLLASKGIGKNVLENFVDPNLEDLKSPLSIIDMNIAVDRLWQAYQKNENICVYADFDLDGTSGLALLKGGLKKLGYKNLFYYQPKRLQQGYGFHKESIDEMKSNNVTLVVTVDVGITANQTVDYANANGVQVIITDHHLPGDELPKAFAIVNPNRKECSSELKYLSGAGVAFYLLRALKRKFHQEGDANQAHLNLRELLDLFTIATVTDMVPLVEDNRILVKAGLKALENTQRAGLKELLKKVDLAGRPISASEVGMKLAPKLNALSRMENGLLPIDIFLSDQQNAGALVMQAFAENELRIQLQNQGEEDARKMAEAFSDKDYIAVCSESFHKGVIGLIATRLQQESFKPCFVGSVNSESVVTGSARSASCSLVEVLQNCSEVLNRFGGHAFAAGFEVDLKNWDRFVELLDKAMETVKSQVPVNWYDFESSLADLNQEFMMWLEKLEPFGQGFKNPVIKLTDFTVSSLRVLKEKHLKLTLESKGVSMDALYFSAGAEIINSIDKTSRIDYLIGEIQWNHFRMQKKPQLILKDIGVKNYTRT
jgi:single-stranded-DNA-specific exonuclease